MKHVKTIDDVIKHEKRYSREYDLDFTQQFEHNLREELEKLFSKFDQNPQNLEGVYMYEQSDDWGGEEFMIIEDGYIFRKVFMSTRGDDCRLVAFED